MRKRSGTTRRVEPDRCYSPHHPKQSALTHSQHLTPYIAHTFDSTYCIYRSSLDRMPFNSINLGNHALDDLASNNYQALRPGVTSPVSNRPPGVTSPKSEDQRVSVSSSAISETPPHSPLKPLKLGAKLSGKKQKAALAAAAAAVAAGAAATGAMDAMDAADDADAVAAANVADAADVADAAADAADIAAVAIVAAAVDISDEAGG